MSLELIPTEPKLISNLSRVISAYWSIEFTITTLNYDFIVTFVNLVLEHIGPRNRKGMNPRSVLIA